MKTEDLHAVMILNNLHEDAVGHST